MKRFALGIFLVLAGVVFVPTQVKAEEITRYEETITIIPDGTITVGEGIRYDFGDYERHGIFRTIPTIKTNEEGKKFVLTYTDFEITDPKGNPYRYSKTGSDGVTTVKIGDPDKTITGEHTYDISYTVAGALTYFSDHDELYWNITGDDWQVPIQSLVARIELPADVAKENVKVACFTGPSGSTETNCTSVYNEKAKAVTVQTNGPLEAYEGLTVVVGFSKGLVAVVEPKEYVPFWETLWGKILILVIVTVAILWYIIAPLVLPILWWKYGRDPKPLIGEATAWFEAPKTKSGRLLTPGETGTLTDERADNADITASIVDFARRGYLKIIEETKGDIHLKKEAETVPGDTLQPFEKILFSGIFKTKNTITLKTADLTKVVTDTKNKLYEAVVEEGFFPKNPQSIRAAFSVASVLGLMTGNFLLFLSIIFFGYHMPRKTIHGAGAAAMAKALKNFITSQERQFKFQAEKQMLFEKMLPFAVAFGVEKIWIARFASMHLAKPDWYQGYSGGRFNAMVFASTLHSTSTNVAHAATPVSSSTGHSSGFSGGSSGGGGGGGGGGSW